MAAGATIHTFTVHLADVDRGVYEELALRVAQHPSETEAFMLIHRADAITLHSFDPGFVDDAVRALERRNEMTVSVTEGQLYLELNGATLSTTVHAHPLE